MDADDNFEKQKKSAEDMTKDKYAQDTAGYSAKELGLGEGVVKERGIKDLLCLIVYLAFLGLMAFLAIYGNNHGRIEKLLAPLDGQDRFCGISNAWQQNKLGQPNTSDGKEANTEAYPKLYITTFKTSPKDTFKSAVCVKTCPKNGDALEYRATTSVTGAQKASYDTLAVMNYCFPKSTDALTPEFKANWKLAKASFLSSGVGSYFNDLYLSSRAIYISCGMSVVYSLIFIYLMSFFAETIAWFCVVLAQLGFIGASIGGWFFRASILENKSLNQAAWKAESDQTLLNENTKADKHAALALAVCIVFGLISCLFLTCIICGFKSLKLAIDVIDAAADFLADTKRILLVPLLYFVLTLIVFFGWLAAYLNVASMNRIKPDTGVIPQFKDLVWEDKKITYMALIMFFGLLWIMAWIKYTCNFVCMVAASTYYFNSAPGKPDGSAEVGLGFKFAHINHMGSIAFGSFIIAVIQFIRFIFLYVAKQAAKASGDNQMVKCLIACGDCILRCIEKICDYLNTAAFAYMAISGDSFCSSAWNGFLLNVKHMLKFTFANFIAKIFTLLGKIGIVVGNLFSLYAIMKYITKDTEEVSSLLGPMVIVGIVSFFTASIFLGLFDTAVMSLMTCLAVDLDVHDGEPAFGPQTFHEGVSKVRNSMDAKPNQVE